MYIYCRIARYNNKKTICKLQLAIVYIELVKPQEFDNGINGLG